MKPEAYRFDVGGFTCYSLLDGAFNYPVEVFCPNVPKQELGEILRAHGLPRSPVNINTDRVALSGRVANGPPGEHASVHDGQLVDAQGSCFSKTILVLSASPDHPAHAHSSPVSRYELQRREP